MARLTNEQILDIAKKFHDGQTEFGNISGIKYEDDTIKSVDFGGVDSVVNNINSLYNSFDGVLNEVNDIESTVDVANYKAKNESDLFAGVVGKVVNAGVVNGSVSKLINKYKEEAYDGQPVRAAQTYALVANLVFSRPSLFESLLFPRITLEGVKSSLDVKKDIPIMFNNFKRDAGVIDQNYRNSFVSIPLALWTEELIKSNSTRIMHILKHGADTNMENERKKYLNEDLKRSATFKGESVEVAPILFRKADKSFNKVDIINLSSLNYSADQIRGDRDSLNNTISVKSYFVKLTAGGQSIFHKLDASNKIGNTFGNVIEQKDHFLQMANAITFELNLSELKKYNATSDANTDAATEFTGQTSSYKKVEKLVVVPNLKIDFASGYISVLSDTVYFETETAGLSTAVTVELVGFELDATLTNTNLREIGQLLGFMEMNIQYQIDYKDPVSVQGATTDLGKGDNDDYKKAIDLGTMINAQSSVYAYKTVVNYFEYLKNFANRGHSEADIINPVERTFSIAYIKPYVAAIEHDVSTTNSLTSTSLMTDICSNIFNRIMIEADKMYNESKYANAFEMVVRGSKGDVKPCVAIVTSTNIAKYLGVDEASNGAMTAPKKLTPNLDYIIVTVPSNGGDVCKEAYESLYMTFVDPTTIGTGTIEEISPLSFGFTVFKNFLTLDFQKTATENVKYLTAFPTYKHVAQLPIMCQIKLAGIPDIVKNKVSMVIKNELFKQQPLEVR